MTGSESEANLPFAGLHQLLRPVLGEMAGMPARQRSALLGAVGLEDSGPTADMGSGNGGLGAVGFEGSGPGGAGSGGAGPGEAGFGGGIDAGGAGSWLSGGPGVTDPGAAHPWHNLAATGPAATGPAATGPAAIAPGGAAAGHTNGPGSGGPGVTGPVGLGRRYGDPPDRLLLPVGGRGCRSSRKPTADAFSGPSVSVGKPENGLTPPRAVSPARSLAPPSMAKGSSPMRRLARAHGARDASAGDSGDAVDASDVQDASAGELHAGRCPRCCRPRRIQSAKGETHAATLILECLERSGKKYDVHEVLGLLSRQQDASKALVTVQRAAQLVFVGATRPTHLLAFAAHRTRAAPHIEAMIARGWSVHDIHPR
ncbi:hypothetical protein [Streptomyces hygroscopicus]|uniref:hypothetical protein n=1 Tax=Streptomyces hygroscopicus TaxID=1912 RepID=UPI0004CC54DB